MAKPDPVERFSFLQKSIFPPKHFHVDDDAAINANLKKVAKGALKLGRALDYLKENKLWPNCYDSFLEYALVSLCKGMSQDDVLDLIRLSRKYTSTSIDKMKKPPREVLEVAYSILMKRYYPFL